MNSDLEQFKEKYAELERSVQKLIHTLCNPLCSQCSQICCRADLCEEAVHSAFLMLLNGRNQLDDDRYGFLTPTGCGLTIGRPPVCHEYFCYDQYYHQPGTQHEELLHILGALVNHVGWNALGNKHLVEITEASQLNQMDFSTLNKQLKESVDALEILQSFFKENTLQENAPIILQKIRFMEEDEK